MLACPYGGAKQALREQAYVETKFAGWRFRLFLHDGEQIQQQRTERMLLQHASDIAIPRTMATAPASMREDH